LFHNDFPCNLADALTPRRAPAYSQRSHVADGSVPAPADSRRLPPGAPSLISAAGARHAGVQFRPGANALMRRVARRRLQDAGQSLGGMPARWAVGPSIVSILGGPSGD